MSLNDYMILEKLGNGSYSSVFKVKRTQDGQLYALKKILIESLKIHDQQNQLNEIRILASIQNPYIVQYKDSFFDQQSQCLCVILEYAQQGDLQEKIEKYRKNKQKFSEQDIWIALYQLAVGLNSIHNVDIVHRDIKTANVFLFSNSNNEIKYKIGDLNVCKQIGNELNYSQTGTPLYASPEIWKNSHYDQKTDIWSLGCIIYEMASLRPPFQASNMKTLSKRICDGYYEAIPKHYSEDLNIMISLLLRVNPFQRLNSQQIINKVQNLKMMAGKIQIHEIQNATLLNFIKLPDNFNELTELLPRNQFRITRIQSKKSQNTTTTNFDQKQTDNMQESIRRPKLAQITQQSNYKIQDKYKKDVQEMNIVEKYKLEQIEKQRQKKQNFVSKDIKNINKNLGQYNKLNLSQNEDMNKKIDQFYQQSYVKPQKDSDEDIKSQIKKLKLRSNLPILKQNNRI